MRVTRFVLALLVAILIGVGAARPALAHATLFTIWGYGFYLDSGTDNHYWHNPMCVECPYDYYIATYVTVFQSYAGQGNFLWDRVNLPGGGVFQSGQAWYGHNSYIYDAQGNPHQLADIFCNPVTWGISLSAGIWSNGPQSYWAQDSGFGPGTCYTSYTVIDRMAVQAGQ